MSFILDQLKRSGKQRELETALRKQAERPEAAAAEPLPERNVDPVPAGPKKTLVAAVAVLLGVAAAYGVAAFLKGPSLMRPPVVPAAKGLVHEASQLPAQPLASPSVQTPRSPAREERVSDIKVTAKEQKQAGAVKTGKSVTVPEKHRTVPEQTGAERPASAMKRPQGTPAEVPAGIDPAGSLAELKQLPLAIRKDLPEIRITSHLYRKDSRLVSINGRIMSEGYNMEDGLFLEEITPVGVILSYGKYRFLVRAER
ncbi:MAG: general secretion pathway protein GspB [Nitrospirae bacterium]|nr:general secretion pathway protein GspB [Nitrospirota bacterium]